VPAQLIYHTPRRRGRKHCQKRKKCVKKTLEEEKMANTLSLEEAEEKILKGLNLLTSKKIIFGLNKKSDAKYLSE
jgi:ribosome-binding ATPase YchF (GTP1/OBG family)